MEANASQSSSAPSPPPQGGTTTTVAANALSAVALESLEQRYVETIRELNAEPQFEPFKTEYERVHRLLMSSHDGEERLLRKARELQEEVSTHELKIGTAMQLSHEDAEAIQVLRKEIEEAWAKADQAHEQEKHSRELVHALKQQVTELDALVERSAGLSMGQETYLRDLLATKKQREEEATVLQSKLDRVQTEHKQLYVLATSAESSHANATRELGVHRTAYQDLLTALETEQRERQSKEESARQYREATERCILLLDQRHGDGDALVRDSHRLQRQLEELGNETQSFAKRLEEKQHVFKAEAGRLASAEQQNLSLANRIPQEQEALEERQSELAQIRRHQKQLEAHTRQQQATLSELVERRALVLGKLEETSSTVSASEAALLAEEAAVTDLEKKVRQAMMRQTQTVVENSAKQNHRGVLEGKRAEEEGKRRLLEQQLEALRVDSQRTRKTLFHAEQQRDHDKKQSQQAMLAHHGVQDQIRAQRTATRQAEEDILHHGKKLKAQQELLSAVQFDRHRMERQLHDTGEELRNLVQRHVNKTEELETMKTDLVSTEASLFQLYNVHQQVQKDLANVEQRLRFLKEDRTHAQSRLAALHAEAQQLRHVIAACDAEATRHKARIGVVTGERNTIGIQLLYRKQELDAVREKMALLDATLHKGATEYERVSQDLLTARDALVEKRLQCRLSLVRLRHVEKLRKQELQQSRLLTQTQARVRALTEELGTQHNVHRWRALEGSTPEVLDALAKIGLLQANLVKKRDAYEATQARVEAATATCEQLKKRLERMPGPEAAEELALYEQNLDARQTQVRELVTELQSVEAQADLLRDEVAQLQDEVAEAKKQFYNEKQKYDTRAREEKLRARVWGGDTGLLAHAMQGLDTMNNTTTHSMTAASSSTASTSTAIGPGSFASGIPRHTPATAHHKNNNKGNKISAKPVGLAHSARGTRTIQEKQKQRHVHQKEEDDLLLTLTAGPPQPTFALQKPPQQRQFAGGGFSLTK